jgi:hypothetical protein
MHWADASVEQAARAPCAACARIPTAAAGSARFAAEAFGAEAYAALVRRRLGW